MEVPTELTKRVPKDWVKVGGAVSLQSVMAAVGGRHAGEVCNAARLPSPTAPSSIHATLFEHSKSASRTPADQCGEEGSALPPA